MLSCGEAEALWRVGAVVGAVLKAPAPGVSPVRPPPSQTLLQLLALRLASMSGAKHLSQGRASRG